MQRWFTDSVAAAVPAVGFATAFAPGASWSQKTNFGWGVGGNVLLPVWPKFVDLQGSVLYGQGIGRYSSSQLADVVIGPNGSLTPITSTQFLVGAVIHPFGGNGHVRLLRPRSDPGQCLDGWRCAGRMGQWRVPQCVRGAGSGLDATPSASTQARLCSANVQRVQEFTVGFWQDIYKGDLGRARVGLQYEYVTLDLFAGEPVPSRRATG